MICDVWFSPSPPPPTCRFRSRIARNVKISLRYCLVLSRNSRHNQEIFIQLIAKSKIVKIINLQETKKYIYIYL